ncbi:hypothetical protein MMC29_003157 [Sticta canariensis]|nr:hypothetical protein [Sticta canariensis]
MLPHIVLAVAIPLIPFSLSQPVGARSSAVSGAQILSIAPASSTCAGAPKLNECRTANQAAAAISSSFGTYGITSPGEMAALTSLMAFETSDFKYNVNYYPGNPGQGTRNMQSAAYNLQYAQSIPALSSSLQAVVDNPNAVRDLLTANDVLDFGSAAWFFVTVCTEGTQAALQNQGVAGWKSYLTDCIGAAPTADREAYWQRAAQVFGVVE